ncbi:protein KRI1 [Capsicum annuum]|uniref:protein KRI1 homolog n=1 Tax=Capsicum annuum TaxID=4072 RepID=UPI001FB04D44|nr:protein KRI1 homolog [Capsicum annuum]
MFLTHKYQNPKTADSRRKSSLKSTCFKVKMVLKLFDDVDDDDKLDKIEINEEFARRYEHNKKREDLQKLEELKKKGAIDDSDTSSSEEEDEEEDLNNSTNLKFFDGLLKIKKGDPVLNNQDAKLFDSDESKSEEGLEEEERKMKKKKKKKKPMYLKDVVSKHLIEEGPEFGDEEEEEEEKKKVKTYSEEQDDLREEFLNAVKEDEDDEDLFKVKETDEERRGDGDTEFTNKLDEFFGEDDKLDEETVFLKDYFRKEMWRDDKKRKSDDVVMEEVEFSEDEEEIERQEDYEREFNFRYEENAGDRVWGHSRKVEGSVRKKTNARKVQRERKEDRMAQAEEERKQELKRLKNLKKKEMKEKLEKIKETAGIGDDGVCLLDVDDLEEEFDPDEYDRKMKTAFGDAYYEADDMDAEFGNDEDELEKPDFDKEDELLGLPKGWGNVDEPRDGFLSTREKLLKAIENEGDHEQTADDNKGSGDDNEVAEEGKRKKKRKRSNTVMKAVREELMEEYYKLDYEDTIGDLKTRFKYRPVKAKRFGLAPEEVLMMEDKELNQYVPLKKIAPYREKEWKVPRIKLHQLKTGLKGVSDVPKSEKKQKFDNKEKVEGETDDRKRKQEESNGDTTKKSGRSRKRKKQAEHNLSTSRLKAYSANPSGSNSKKK